MERIIKEILRKELKEEIHSIQAIEGLEISQIEYNTMYQEIMVLNYLHRLDKYRWAESYDLENIEEYEKKVRDTFEKIE